MTRDFNVQPFKFKKFSVAQELVTMKVGFDGVLVGAWASIDGVNTVLDIGTGSGLIALIIAQRIGENANIHAIDVDKNSILQAKGNFKNSPWASVFTLHHQSIQDFARTFDAKYDLIISNPPFFTGGMMSENDAKNDARHTIKLPHGDLLLAVDRLLHDKGKLVLILPYLQGLRFMEISQTYRLFASKITEVISKQGKTVERLMIEFSRTKKNHFQNQLLVYEEGTQYTEEYKALTKDFYLNF
ncbi:MAG: methyltransferase [Saprospiraceae bacterium]